MKKIIFIMLLAIIGFGSKTMGQNCISALYISDTVTNTISVNSDTVWSKLQVSNDTASITFIIPYDSIVNIYKINIYNGNSCNSLNLINSYMINDSIRTFNFTDLVVGSDYYFEIVFNNNFIGELNSFITYHNYEYRTCYDACNIVNNGRFECLSNDLYVGSLPTLPAGNIYDPFHNNRVMGWKAGWGTPNIAPFFNGATSNEHYASIWAMNYNSQGASIGESIYQDIDCLVDGVSYELSFNYKIKTHSYNSLDFFIVKFADFTPVSSGLDGDFIPTIFTNEYPLYLAQNVNTGDYWQNVTVGFTKQSGKSKRLLFYPMEISYSPYQLSRNSIYIDNVKIKPLVNISFIPNYNYDICPGQIVTISAQIPPICIVSWQWTSSSGFTANTQSITVAPTITTTYTVTATDFTGCQYSKSYIVYVKPAPIVNAGEDITVCLGENEINLGANLVVSGDAPQPYTYVWTDQNGNIISTNQNPLVTPVSTTTYTVTVTSANGCSTSDDIKITVVQPEKPLIDGPNSICSLENNIYTISNFDPSYTYTWQLTDPSYGTISLIQGSPDKRMITWSNNGNIGHCIFSKIKVFAQDQFGCVSISEFKVYNCCKGDANDIVYNNEVTLSNSQFVNENFVFNEDLYINGDVSFINSTIHMTPNTKIIVNPNSKLYIDNTDVSAFKRCCEEMWDGIYVEQQSSELYVLNTSVVKNAQNAIVSRNKGLVDLSSSNFTDNYRNIILEQTLPVFPLDFSQYPFSIKNCRITGNFSLPNEPYLQKQTYSGIEAKNILNLQIGNYTEVSDKNTFENLYCGIKGINSNMYIHNNDFFNIVLPQGIAMPAIGSDPTAIYQPTAIHSVFQNELKKIPVCELVVGQSNIQYTNNNNMYNCQNGIYSYNQRVDIYGNYIESNNYGIWSKNLLDLSFIKENTIGTNTAPSTYGIFANIISATLLNLSITNNLVFPVIDGISVANCLSEPRSNEYQVNISDNMVYFNPAFNSYAQKYRSGIKSHYNTGVLINCNQIHQLLSAPIPTDFTGLFGVNTINTIHGHILNNYTSKMGAGINAFGYCNYSRYDCNQIEDSYYGFLFNKDATITDQGSTSTNTDNTWVGNFANGSGDFRKLWEASSLLSPTNPINWYVQNLTGSIFDPEITMSNPTFSKIIPNYNSNGSSTCINCQTKSFGSPTMDAILREKLYGKIVRNENNYVSLDEQYKVYDMTTLYSELKSDTNLMYMGDTADAAYQQFYAAQQADNTGKFDEVQNLIKDGDIAMAMNRNSSVQDQKMIDYYLKTATDMYLKTYCADNYNLSAYQLDFLTGLANITPWEGGEGVYIARYMLNIEDDLNEAEYAINRQGNNTAIQSNTAKLYPNPAQNEVMIEFDKPLATDGLLEIYGFTANKIQSIELKSGKQFISVSTKDLKPGIYMYRILLNDKIVAKDKLLIIK